MPSIFESLLEEYILPETDKNKQIRIARAVLEGNALLQKVAVLENLIARMTPAPIKFINRPTEARWLISEHNRFAEASNGFFKPRKKGTNDRYSWTHKPT